jgi:hypothetical protein
MKIKVIHLLLFCQTVTAFALIAGFSTFHEWIGVSVIFLSVCLLWLGEKKQWKWTNSLVFVIQICIAIFGSLKGVSAYLMIIASVGALTSWDLIDLLTKQMVSADNPFFEKYKNNRLKYLSLAIGIGLFVAEIGLLIHLKLPFAMVFLIGGVILYCLYQLFSILRHK